MKKTKYRLGFDVSAVILFILILLPNIFWAFLPAPNDILKTESRAPLIDAFATTFQVLMLTVLISVKNINYKKVNYRPFIVLTVISGLLYYICWVLYYFNTVTNAVLIGLCVFPCCSFLFYALARKNYLALIPVSIFSVLHFISTVINFL